MMRTLCDRPKGTSKPPKTLRKNQTLIGNGMHSRVCISHTESNISIFLIGNEFNLFGTRSGRLRQPRFLKKRGVRGVVQGSFKKQGLRGGADSLRAFGPMGFE